MGEWTALAEALAEDAREPGFGAAASVAAAWRARVDPAATRSLVTAAVVLAGPEVIPALWAAADPCPDAAALCRWAEDLEAHIGDLLRRCLSIGYACRAAHEAACEARIRALQDARRAEAAMIAADTPAAKAQFEAAVNAAREEAARAALAIADCEAALEILGDADARLRCALDRVRALPADHDETYEAPVRLVAAGGVLPHSGDFITAGDAPDTVREEGGP